MPKEFYTERDIEDLVKRGVLSLVLSENVVLTDLAYEKANRLGMQLVRDKPENPPGAPVRPYLSQAAQPVPGPTQARGSTLPQPAPQSGRPQVVLQPQQDGSDLHQRIRSAVQARLGNQVDSALLDVIIKRVLQNTGIK
jgi:hypothetical protein